MEPARGERDDGGLVIGVAGIYVPQWSPLVVSGMTVLTGVSGMNACPRRNGARSW